MHLIYMTLLLAVTSVLSSPTPEKRQRLDADAIMADVYSNTKGFNDLEFKISPEIYDEVMSQFRRFERDYPEPEEEEKKVHILPQDPVIEPVAMPHPPVFPKLKTRFFRMF